MLSLSADVQQLLAVRNDVIVAGADRDLSE